MSDSDTTGVKRDARGRILPGSKGIGGGRKPGPDLNRMLADHIQGCRPGQEKTMAQEFVEMVVERALAGDDFRFVKELLDRVSGPVRVVVEQEIREHFKLVDRELHDEA